MHDKGVVKFSCSCDWVGEVFDYITGAKAFHLDFSGSRGSGGRET